MINQFFEFPSVLQRLYANPLGPYIDEFITLLVEQGYTRLTSKSKIQLIGKFNRWLYQKQLKVDDLNDKKVTRFLKYQRRHSYVRRGDVTTLKMLLEQLRNAGKIPPVPPPKIDNSPLHRIERRFVKYLVEERNLSQTTLRRSIPLVLQFLTEHFGKGRISLDELRPSDVTQFIVRYVDTNHRLCAKMMAYALRSFLRFLHISGDTPTNLALAVPTVPNWRLTSIPKSIEPKQVEHLLKSCNQNTTTGLRNYAVMLLLARLGLRSNEIVSMTLDDIDWESGELRVHGKGGQQDLLPIPQDVGEALAKYLRYGRPACSTRQVFIRLKAPYRGVARSGTLGSIVRRALERTDIQAPHKGSHLLRHSLAIRMLRNGASMSEIGQVLRHRSMNTTEIYTKVDLTTLRKLAQPWPGGKSS